MQKYFNTAADSEGRPIAAASVFVYETGTTVLATLYSDNGSTLTGNPVSTDSNGLFAFYADDGRYDIAIVKTGYATVNIVDLLLDDTSSGGLSGTGLTLTGTGGRIKGNFTASALIDRHCIQTTTANGITNVPIIPDGTGGQSGFSVHNGSDPDNAGYGQVAIDTTKVAFVSSKKGTGAYLPAQFFTSDLQRLEIDVNGSIAPGTAALATNATSGFIYMTTSAGAPTGAPTAKTGRVAFHYDTTNNRFYIYNGAWRSVLLS